MSFNSLWASPTDLSYGPPRQLLKGILCFSFWLSTWLLPTWLRHIDAISQFCFDWFVVQVALMQGPLFRAHNLWGVSLCSVESFFLGFEYSTCASFPLKVCVCVCLNSPTRSGVFVSGLPFTLNQKGLMNSPFIPQKAALSDETSTVLFSL